MRNQWNREKKEKNASMTNCWEAKVNQLLEKRTRKKIEQNNAIAKYRKERKLKHLKLF